MRSDRATKILLAIIALGIWALAMTQLELPEAQAGTGSTAQDSLMNQERPERREVVSAEPHAPTSTKPLRWRIPWALHKNSLAPGSPDCATIVSVVNFGPAGNDVDVEFFNSAGNSTGLANRVVNSSDPDVFVSNANVPLTPFLVDASAGASTFDGFALVTADDPRIAVTAMMRCSDDGENLPLTINSIPAYPVGTSAEYFQAGMPETWMPPVAVPEESGTRR